jgi:hypothetical protein
LSSTRSLRPTRVFTSHTTDGAVELEREELPPPADESTIAVVGSGNLEICEGEKVGFDQLS